MSNCIEIAFLAFGRLSERIATPSCVSDRERKASLGAVDRHLLLSIVEDLRAAREVWVRVNDRRSMVKLVE